MNSVTRSGPNTVRRAPIEWPAGAVVVLNLILHLVTSALGGYGYFRDELYYLACSDHPGFGYVDHPPLSIWILAVNRSLFGDSLFALLLLPALAGAATVFLTALIAREMGGRRIAQLLAALAVTVSPVFMGMSSFFSMNAFDLLFWSSSFYFVTRLINTEDKRYLFWIGLVIGVGLLNKISMSFFALGFFLGIVLTPHRRMIRTKELWIAGLIAVALFSPYLIWNSLHDWAHLEFIRNASAGKYADLTMARFLTDQFLINNPVNVIVWGSGLLFFFTPMGKRYRLGGLIFLAAAFVLLLNRTSKAEYLSAGYTILFAGGGVFLEEFLSRSRHSWLPGVAVGILGTGLLIVPMGLPVLPVNTFIRYMDMLGVQPMTSERIELAALPQFYADMFGWEEQAETLAKAYHSLSPEDRNRCAVFGWNYGRAGAIDFFGKAKGLPPAISGHNSYWLWGPGTFDGALLLLLASDPEELRTVFESVEPVGTHTAAYALPYENRLKVYLCRNLTIPLQQIWNEVKIYH